MVDFVLFGPILQDLKTYHVILEFVTCCCLSFFSHKRVLGGHTYPWSKMTWNDNCFLAFQILAFPGVRKWLWTEGDRACVAPKNGLQKPSVHFCLGIRCGSKTKHGCSYGWKSVICLVATMLAFWTFFQRPPRPRVPCSSAVTAGVHGRTCQTYPWEINEDLPHLVDYSWENSQPLTSKMSTSEFPGKNSIIRLASVHFFSQSNWERLRFGAIANMVLLELDQRSHQVLPYFLYSSLNSLWPQLKSWLALWLRIYTHGTFALSQQQNTQQFASIQVLRV